MLTSPRPLILLLSLSIAACGVDQPQADDTKTAEFKLEVSANLLKLAPRESVRINAAVSTTSTRIYVLSFASSNSLVASVDSDGLVEGVAVGKATVTVTATLLDSATKTTASINVEVGSATTGPAVTLSPAALGFGNQAVGSTSAVALVTITNSGTAPLTFPTGFVIAGDFGFGGLGTCSTTAPVAPGASCTASLDFAPTAAGARSGSLTIQSNAATSPNRVLLSGVGTVETSGPQLFVTTAGADSNAGTSLAPFKTLQQASKVATAGTTVWVGPGTYAQNVVTSANGTAAARIRYVSQLKGQAKIVGSGTEFTWNNKGNYVDIVDFDISGTGRLGIFNEGSFVLVQGNHVHDLKVSGGCTGSGGAVIVNGNYSSTDNDIIGNVVHDVGTPGACNGVQGIYHSHLRGRIQNNLVYRVSAWGIHLWHAADAVQVVNNTVFANGGGSMGGGIVMGSGDSGAGVVNNSTISNNIVVNNPAGAIAQYCYQGVTCIGNTNSVRNNLVFGNGGGIALLVGTPTGTLTADPKFVNYQANGTGDYHLQSTSPAINAGTSTAAPMTDLDGIGRPRGAGFDIGAYEF
jgi:hypothetical protein